MLIELGNFLVLRLWCALGANDSIEMDKYIKRYMKNKRLFFNFNN